MPNPFFRFKQFTVYHNLCAMKVGTDGVLLGAWAPLNGTEKSILDVGSGSGLIALMLAQRSPNAFITAIDVDLGAVQQSQFNFTNSPWTQRLSVQNISVQEMAQQNSQKYDLIVSNPPFFVNSLKNPNQQRATARHTDTLSFAQLFQSTSKLLQVNGLFAVIAPLQSEKELMQLAADNALFMHYKTVVIPKEGVAAKRVMLAFSTQQAAPIITSLTIEGEFRKVYTPDFKALTAEFYL